MNSDVNGDGVGGLPRFASPSLAFTGAHRYSVLAAVHGFLKTPWPA